MDGQDWFEDHVGQGWPGVVSLSHPPAAGLLAVLSLAPAAAAHRNLALPETRLAAAQTGARTKTSRNRR